LKKKMMKHISIIVPDGQSSLASVACIVGTYEIFATANAQWAASGKTNTPKVEVVGVTTESAFENGLVAIRAQRHISELNNTNLIIIPSLVRDYETAMAGNKDIIDWIAKQYKHGAEVASMCTGTFMLAAAGLLDGKNCSTHWSAANLFREKFPEVHLLPDRLITDEHGIYTNGGAYSFLNLLLYLVEKYYDRPTAIYCSKIFQIEMDRQNQSPFIIFKGQKQHGDDVVQQAQAYIEDNLQDKISIEELSARFAVGRRNFDRRFIKATGNTPIEYAQRVKMESAKKALETTRKTINEVMYDVGYSDVKAFREVFRKITGLSPIDYKARYNKETAAYNETGMR
jgi:transcriptional regulator GlxA family with amidase domain